MINNNSVKTEKLVTMCTGQYLTEFDGNWNGTSFDKVRGEIKIPEELENFIDFPISEIIPKAETQNTSINGTFQKLPRFKTDTLELNKTYTFRGQITEITSGKSIFKGRIINGS